MGHEQGPGGDGVHRQGGVAGRRQAGGRHQHSRIPEVRQDGIQLD